MTPNNSQNLQLALIQDDILLEREPFLTSTNQITLNGDQNKNTCGVAGDNNDTKQ
jgi:hypothetical protein